MQPEPHIATPTSKIKEILFPVNRNYRYYDMHYKYVLATIKAAGIPVQMSDTVAQVGGAAFEVAIDGQKVVIDFFNYTDVEDGYKDYPFYFKFHYTEGLHESMPNLFPFPTISFWDWNQYAALKKVIHYTAQSNIILSNQRPYGNAIQRRKKIQKMLKDKYGRMVDTHLTAPDVYWQKINNCLVSVCVPGARNDILDKGQFQFMAFGACTISPQLPTLLPEFQRMEDGVHYLVCKDDYSDLFERIEWCRENREACVAIGRNAQQLFEATSLPGKIWQWVEKVMYG